MTSTRRALWWTLAAWLGIYAARELAQGPPPGMRPQAHTLGVLLDVALGAPICFLILLFIFRVGAGVRKALMKQETDTRRPE